MFEAILAVGGTILTLWQFASPWPQLRRAAALHTMDQQDLVTLMSMAVNSILWSTYAIFISDEGIFLQNGACLVLGVHFNLFFLRHSRRKEAFSQFWAATFGCLTCILGWCLFGIDERQLEHSLGLVCAFSNLQVQCSPFYQISLAVQRRDFSDVPLGVAFVGGLSSMAWTAYGWMTGNPYLGIPYALAIGASFIQISLYLKYHRTGDHSISV
eukprot:TRINITY_DN17954_c0_g1_i1.p1 TRINITY_DN17954_c0_g1~~TRINITY_DN17954_c0_g1_i1.p1  ORF type:complete len:213 (-),score=12.74 TRINITY_DN17954_c0_g1_i1:18-656(-)